MKTIRFSVAMCLLAACVSPIAAAQGYDDDLQLDEDERGNAVTKTTTTQITSTTTRIPGTSDHQFAVRKLGVGFMGIQSVVALDPRDPGNSRVFSAPTIGARYWFDSMLAVEAGLGLNLNGGGNKVDKSSSDDINSFTGTAIAFRVGVPLSLYDSEHYSFQIIPDFHFSYGKLSETYNDPNPDVPAVTTNFATTTWGLGFTAGAEIYFGFMNIPELSVQAGVGFNFSKASSSSGIEPRPEETPLPTADYHEFSTNLDGAPWDIFTGSLRALYYF